MGKSVVIKGADFSENAIGRVGEWETILEETLAPPTEVYNIGQTIVTGTLTRLTVVDITQSSLMSLGFGVIDTNNQNHDNFWGGSFSPTNLPKSVGEKVSDCNFNKLRMWLPRTTSITIKLEKCVFE